MMKKLNIFLMLLVFSVLSPSALAFNSMTSEYESLNNMISNNMDYFMSTFRPKDRSNKPNVLIIGDSIAASYQHSLRYFLREKYDVFKAPHNQGSTRNGIKFRYLKNDKKKYTKIVFNFGLHDLKINGNVSLNEYRSNLETIILKLRETKADLIFVTTTPVPRGTKNRKFNAQKSYNEIAIKLMKKYGVDVCNLEKKLIEHNQMKKIQLPNNVHFNELGNLFNGYTVANCIMKD